MCGVAAGAAAGALIALSFGCNLPSLRLEGQYLVSQSCAQEDQSADFSYISIMLKLGDMRIGNIWT